MKTKFKGLWNRWSVCLILFPVLMLLFVAASYGQSTCTAQPHATPDSSGSLTLNFTGAGYASDSSAITGWLWDFGDGATSTLQNPTHAYAAMGTYMYTLSITSATCSGSRADSTTFYTVTGCKADFSSDSSATGTGLVLFTDLSSPSPGGTITSWFWNFGDGTTSTQQHPQHTYSQTGQYYSVTLTITDSKSCSHNFSHYVYVPGAAGPNCAASFTFQDDPVIDGLVYFTDQSSASTGGIVTSWLWDFGDGTTSTQQNPQHTYYMGGGHYVTLSITDDKSCNHTKMQFVHSKGTILYAYLGLDSISSSWYCIVPANAICELYLNTDGYQPNDSFKVEMSYGDGVSEMFYVNDLTPIDVPHTYTMPGTYSLQMIVTAPDGKSDTAKVIDAVVVSATCGPISGKVHRDTNSNCVMDAGELPLPGIQVYLYQNGVFKAATTTDGSGDYSFLVPPGSGYGVWVNYYYQSNMCPAGGYTALSTPSSGNNFGVSCDTTNTNAFFYLSGSVSKNNNGAITYLYPSWMNSFSCGSGLSIKIVGDPAFVSPVQKGSGTYTISGDTVIYPFVVGWGWYWNNYTLLPNAQIGDTVCFQVIIEGQDALGQPFSTTDVYCFPVRAAYDPNAKESFIGTTNVTGQNIQPDQTMTYTIQFQNTGNDTAHHVFLLDTLSANLVDSTFFVVASSHPVQTYLYGDLVKFDFPNIMLPDSNVNEPLSHGFVTYRIAQQPGLAPGETITNTAHIFFDNNPAVITNTVVNTIAGPSGIQERNGNFSPVTLYPNPAKDKLVVALNGEKGITRVEVYDALGNLLMHQGVVSEHTTLNLSGLATGIYFIRLSGEVIPVTRMVQVTH